jgi:hypothetical protein
VEGGVADQPLLTERQKMLAGDLYDPFDPELVAARERARDLCQALNSTRERARPDSRRDPQPESVGRPDQFPSDCAVSPRLSSGRRSAWEVGDAQDHAIP